MDVHRVVLPPCILDVFDLSLFCSRNTERSLIEYIPGTNRIHIVRKKTQKVQIEYSTKGKSNSRACNSRRPVFPEIHSPRSRQGNHQNSRRRAFETFPPGVGKLWCVECGACGKYRVDGARRARAPSTKQGTQRHVLFGPRPNWIVVAAVQAATPGEVQARRRTPPRHNSCRPNRTKNLGAAMKDRSWHDTDKHSRTGRLLGCCRLKARLWNWLPGRLALEQKHYSVGAMMFSPCPPEGGHGLRRRVCRL